MSTPPPRKLQSPRILFDIQKNMHLEKENHEIQAKLVQSAKLASIGTLAAGMAHEINNPLAVIRAYVSLLKIAIEEGTYGEKNLEDLDLLDRSVDRVATIVQSLLSFSQNDTEALEIVDLHRFWEKAQSI